MRHLLILCASLAVLADDIQFEIDNKIEDEVSVARRVACTTLTIQELNEFHLAILGRVHQPLSESAKGDRKRAITVDYAGILVDPGQQTIAIDDSGTVLTRTFRVHGSVGDPVSWYLSFGDDVTCEIWISVEQTRETVCACALMSGGKVHVNVASVGGKRVNDNHQLAEQLQTMLEGYGDASIRSTLERLAGPLSDIERVE